MLKFIHKNHAWINALLTIGIVVSGYFFNTVGWLPKTFNIGDAWFHICIYLWHAVFVAELFFYGKSSDSFKSIEEDRDKFKAESERYKALFERLAQNIEGALHGTLIRAGALLQFSSQPEKIDRITLYYLDEERGFFALSRHSENPSFEKIRTDKQYPTDKGCIGKGWDNTWWFDNQFPCPEQEWENYINRHRREYKIIRAEARGIKMKSRLYAVHRVDVGIKKLGVIVFESKNPSRFEENQIRESLSNLSKDVGPLLASIDAYSTMIANRI